MKATPAIEKQRHAHHEALRKLALECGVEVNGLTLWRKLVRIERETFKVCLDYTNGDNGVDLAQWDAAKDKARNAVRAIFGGALPHGFFVNGDPRGHMLKIDSDVRVVPDGMERDWGGNGLLAPMI